MRAGGGEAILKTGFGEFRAACSATRIPGEKVLLGFRPEAVEIGNGELNTISTTIRHVSYLGEIEQYGLEAAPEVMIKALEQNPREIRKPGSTLEIHIRPANALIIDR